MFGKKDKAEDGVEGETPAKKKVGRKKASAKGGRVKRLRRRYFVSAATGDALYTEDRAVYDGDKRSDLEAKPPGGFEEVDLATFVAHVGG